MTYTLQSLIVELKRNVCFRIYEEENVSRKCDDKDSLFEKIKDEIKKCNVTIVVHIIVILLLFLLFDLKPL